MATKTTTGIKLAQHNASGLYRLNRPDHRPLTISSRCSLDDCATAAGLSNGYWLRDTPTPSETTWTWVQL